MLKKMFFVLVLVCITTGCSHVWHPGRAPEISLDTVGRFDESYSVDLIHDQPDTRLRFFGNAGFHKHYADYNEWTKFFISQYAMELEKRGVKVTKDSANKIKVKLSDFLFAQGFARVRTNIKIRLYDDMGWQKEYDETDTSGLSIGRAFGSVTYHSIEKLLKEKDVMERMRD